MLGLYWGLFAELCAFNYSLLEQNAPAKLPEALMVEITT